MFSVTLLFFWSERLDSNQRPPAPKKGSCFIESCFNWIIFADGAYRCGKFIPPVCPLCMPHYLEGEIEGLARMARFISPLSTW